MKGLQDQSKRPHNSPATKVGKPEEKWILDLRKRRKLGARCIQNELFREHDCSLSLATIHKVLTRHQVKPFRRHRRRTAANTLLFLEQVVEAMPFPIQRIQTDRGREFFAVKVQEKMMEYGIKFRPNKPGSPHLNGKVERSQRTDKEEFYPTVNLDLSQLQQEALPEWQHYYNWYRAHGLLKGKTPCEKISELSE